MALALSLQAVIPQASAAGLGGPAGVTPLNHGWLFGGEYTAGSEAPGFDDSGFQSVTTPHVVAPLSWKLFDNNTWNKIWIYRNHFDLPSGTSGSDRTFVDFDGVLTIATPYINGQELPTHEGGYLPFTHEITDHVKQTGNVLSVIVDARWSYVNPEGNPGGPSTVDYLEPGGINRDVALRTVPSSFISDVFAKPVNVLDSSSRQVEVESTIDSTQAAGQIQINSQLQDAGKVLSQTTKAFTVSQPGNSTFTVNVPAPNVELWSPDSPNLYQMVTTLSVGGNAVHSFTRNIGFRETNWTTDGFFLNGERLQVFGLNRHQLFPYIGMSAPQRLQENDAKKLKQEFNANMVRCSHYPQSPYFLDMCDQLGLMVWQEVAGWGFVGNDTWQQHVISDTHDMVIRDRSRPSIVLWGVQVNESPREPALYTQTRQVADDLDGTRQTSGTETSQSLDNWVVDVFAYDDYHHNATDAQLAPPITSVPYLVTEAVGALDGPKFYRFIDQQSVLQTQGKLHAEVHDIAAGNKSFSGLLGWAFIDYASMNGNQFQFVKTPGMIDSFRVAKPGSAYYISQVSPAERALIEPAFFWDFGPTSPVTTLGDMATIWSNCDTLQAYINDNHYATLSPDTNRFPNTAFPPFYLDTTKLNASTLPELRVDGFVAGKKAVSRAFSGDTMGDKIKMTLHDPQLKADGIDSTLISFRGVDRFGNPRPYSQGNVTISIKGPGEYYGQLNPEVPGPNTGTTGVFPFGENGGVGGVLIRTLNGKTGTITVQVSHPTLGIDTVRINAV